LKTHQSGKKTEPTQDKKKGAQRKRLSTNRKKTTATTLTYKKDERKDQNRRQRTSARGVQIQRLSGSQLGRERTIEIEKKFRECRAY